jgi:hypothetical protein
VKRLYLVWGDREEKHEVGPIFKFSGSWHRRIDMKIVSKILDVVCFVLGPVVLVTNTLEYFRGITGGGDSLFFIAIGFGLICIGLLRKYWKKEAK